MTGLSCLQKLRKLAIGRQKKANYELGTLFSFLRRLNSAVNLFGVVFEPRGQRYVFLSTSWAAPGFLGATRSIVQSLYFNKQSPAALWLLAIGPRQDVTQFTTSFRARRFHLRTK